MNDLDELDRLHAAATAGEWTVSDRVDFWSVRTTEGETAFDDGSACDEYANQCTQATRDAIVALYNAWPEVSARLRAAKAVLRALVACDDAINRGDEPPLSRSELAIAARAALGEP